MYINFKQEFNSIYDILESDVKFYKKRGKNVKYSNVASAFDIETSSFYENNEKRSCMYIYVIGINGKVKLGRTWEEFLTDINTIIQYYDISLSKRFIIYVHNLSYEFQFIRKLFEWKEVFSVDMRRPVYACTKDGIEFRCSYILSQYSLETVGKNLTKYKVEKLKGDLDYKLIRHSTTPITDKEKQYVINDGLVVMSYIQELIDYDGDITKIPLTGTGFARKLCKQNCLHNNSYIKNRCLMKRLQLTCEEYKQLKRAYQGGFTHANSLYVRLKTPNVHSFDFTSSYPSILILEKFPMGKGKVINLKNKEDFSKYLHKYCCLFDVKFYGIKSSVNYEHYIGRSKCWKCVNPILDNGRIVEAEEIGTTITEQDFFIIQKFYKWKKMEIFNFTIYQKNYLPTEFVKTCLQLYEDKTQLKGVDEMVQEYARSKFRLNALYGMCVTDIAKDNSIYEDGEWSSKPKDLEEAITKYNTSKSRFLFYAWGVWITAYARRNLFTGIYEFKNDYLYSDTDSLKVINIDKHQKYFEDYNNLIREKIKQAMEYHKLPIERCIPKTIKGIEKCIGVWDWETKDGVYDWFKTLGAKRYITVQGDDIHITISGVNKKNGAEFLKWKFKTMDNVLDNFDNNLVFNGEYVNDKGDEKSATGKSVHTYIDFETKGVVQDYLGVKNYYHELASIHMEATDYSMSLSNEFIKYLTSLRSSEWLF